MYNLMNEAVFLARHQVQSEPGFIIGPIAWLFGIILDFMFNIVYFITPNNSLGLAIILLTVVAMTMMLPLNVKAQRSMIAMQKLNPEIEKIKQKYGNKTDAETKQKIGQETQALMAKHKVNPLGSCLPMLIQMPLFFGLLHIMNQSYLYIDTLNTLYVEIAEVIQYAPNYVETFTALIGPRGASGTLLANDWFDNGLRLRDYINRGHDIETALNLLGTSDVIVLANPENMARVLDRFTEMHWNALFYGGEVNGRFVPALDIQALTSYNQEALRSSFDRLRSIELFLGLPLKENSGWFPPGIIIPILAVVTTTATSWFSQQINKSKDPNQKTMQTVMMVVMPLFMGFITVGMPAAVGLYWITSNLYRLIQQIVMNKKAGVPFRLPFMKKAEA
ncbi:MAG: YidC/Oxa1 family membrane protein insertase [Defluviitaleaceae bacterium]|nr:YidC/Oxa1 family membrane protein insertase [Defluviitaleaceae bacterium]